MRENTDPQILALEQANPLREPTLRAAISELQLAPGTHGLDIGCGIGLQTLLLAEATHPFGQVTGLDISPELLAYAQERVKVSPFAEQVWFKEGDMAHLPFDENTFDWGWSADCVGYPTADHLPLLKEIARVVRPGGRVALLAWTSQQVLPGHAVLEARLNAEFAAYLPYLLNRDPEGHFLRLARWFPVAGIKQSTCRTFIGEVQAPVQSAVPRFHPGPTRLLCLLYLYNVFRRRGKKLNHQHPTTLYGKSLLKALASGADLTGLQGANLDGCGLSAVPPGIFSLASLTLLSLYDNLLTEIPTAIAGLRGLSTLNLGQNRLEAIPEDLGSLVLLEMLDLGHNYIRSLPASLGALKYLAFLYLSNNQLECLPESLGGLGELHYLNLTDNHFAELPTWIGRLEGLIELRVYNNALTQLPTQIGQLSNLVELHAEHNQIEKLPDEIGQLSSLSRINLQSNKLCELPEAVGGLSDLTELNLRFNSLLALPASFTRLQSLEYLDLRANELTSLPDDLDSLTSLRKLDLRWNRLEKTPRCLETLAGRGCVVYT